MLVKRVVFEHCNALLSVVPHHYLNLHMRSGALGKPDYAHLLAASAFFIKGDLMLCLL